ncbi:hypothetical protein [Hymenobacter psychrophilus]|uniref:Uncharacterized protein n=1 Tax=Hymenobacter psychrophilus TaxID=651662 RepID=A0A1H3PBZ3_9BACT|nr:hypothetical protein [Hymenobacter psychrophilus]SDY97909.1 hypothetical protein SAMN04488069_1262 [Hymenobacter psychrophilus]
MIYDEQALKALEGETRSAAFRLGKVTAPVVARLEADIATFNVLTATRQDVDRTSELETMLAALQAYCESAAAYTDQLATNLAASQQAMYAEATRAAFAMRQMQLVHQDLLREKKMTDRWWNAVHPPQNDPNA